MWAAESQDKAVFPIALTEDEQRVVNAERDCHPDSHVRRKMLVLVCAHKGHRDESERRANNDRVKRYHPHVEPRPSTRLRRCWAPSTGARGRVAKPPCTR
jgi:hypothetical protein